MSRHPQEWWTSTLLLKHGPADPSEYLVLDAIDKLSINGQVLTIGQPELAEAARMDIRTLKAAVRRLRAAGLLTVLAPPGGYARGRATRYHIEREPMILAAVQALSTAPEKGGTDVPLLEMEGGQGRTPLGPERGTDLQEKGGIDVPPGIKGIERGGGGAREGAPVDMDTPPPPCPRHPNGWDHPENCHACRRLREWDQRQTARADADRRAQAGEVPWCGQCDSDSYRWVLNEDGTPLRRCPLCNIHAQDYAGPRGPRDDHHQTSALVMFQGDTARGRADMDAIWGEHNAARRARKATG